MRKLEEVNQSRDALLYTNSKYSTHDAWANTLRLYYTNPPLVVYATYLFVQSFHKNVHA